MGATLTKKKTRASPKTLTIREWLVKTSIMGSLENYLKRPLQALVKVPGEVLTFNKYFAAHKVGKRFSSTCFL